MTTIIELPAQKAPKQLTARSTSHNLHEHFLAFLNANNPTGFSADEFSADEIAPIEADTIVELLVSVSQHDAVSERTFKRLATRLKKTSGGAIKHSRALEIVSRVFGYAHWYQASKMSESGGKVFRNRRNRSALNLQKLLGLEVTALP
jgi:hypothetical protein